MYFGWVVCHVGELILFVVTIVLLSVAIGTRGGNNGALMTCFSTAKAATETTGLITRTISKAFCRVRPTGGCATTSLS